MIWWVIGAWLILSPVFGTIVGRGIYHGQQTYRPPATHAHTLRCRIFGHKTKKDGMMKGYTDTEPLPSGHGERTWKFIWCYRCERYVPGYVYVPDWRTFP